MVICSSFAMPIAMFHDLKPADVLLASERMLEGRLLRSVTPLLLWWLCLASLAALCLRASHYLTNLAMSWAGVEPQRLLPLVALFFIIGLFPNLFFDKINPPVEARLVGPEYLGEIAAELNVQVVESFASAGDLVDYSAKGNFRALGRRFGKSTPQVAAAIAAADAARLASELASSGEASVDFDGGTTVTADEVIVSERPREGWSVVNEQGETVALDLELTPELVRAGLVRDVVRLVQEQRKASGLEVSDRIALTWAASGQVAEALREASGLLAGDQDFLQRGIRVKRHAKRKQSGDHGGSCRHSGPMQIEHRLFPLGKPETC